MHPKCQDGGCVLLHKGGTDMCEESNRCALEQVTDAGYEVHEKGEIQQVQKGSPVAAHLRLGDQTGTEQGGGDQGSVGSNQTRDEPPLTFDELRFLRKHMRLWAR